MPDTAPIRLAYLVSHPIQYQAPLLRAIAADPEIDLKVFFCSAVSVRAYLLAFLISGGAPAGSARAANAGNAGDAALREGTIPTHAILDASETQLAQRDRRGRGRGDDSNRGSGERGGGDQNGHRGFHKKMNEIHRSWHQENSAGDRDGANGDGRERDGARGDRRGRGRDGEHRRRRDRR